MLLIQIFSKEFVLLNLLHLKLNLKLPLFILNLSPSTVKSRHSPNPPPTNLEVTLDKFTNTVASKKKLKNLEVPVFIHSGILPPTLHTVHHASQTKTLTDQLLRTHPKFKATRPY